MQFVEAYPFDAFDEQQPCGRHVDHREVGVDAGDAADSGERIAAALDDLPLARLGRVLHHHVGLLGADGEVHRAADGRDRVGRAGVPVGEVARDRDLERAEDADVEVAAAHHREAVGVVEERAAGQERHRLLAGVDEVEVLVAFLRRRAHADDAVLAVQDDLAPGRQVIRDQRRQADAEVDDRAVGDVARDPRAISARLHLVLLLVLMPVA